MKLLSSIFDIFYYIMGSRRESYKNLRQIFFFHKRRRKRLGTFDPFPCELVGCEIENLVF